MLTIFTIPKPFTAETELAQRNAIQSWLRLGKVQIILCGDDDGVAEAAVELGCEHYPTLRRTSLGTPQLDDAFSAAEHLARHELICYVNADIILLNGFQPILGKLTDPAFLIAGRRVNVWLPTAIPFEQTTWDIDLWEWAQREGQYAEPAGSDYFMFRRGTLGAIPPFAVGRQYWDNWMMFRARRRGWPLIDGTPVIRAIHQNHGYEHVPNAVGGIWRGPETNANLKAAGGYRNVFTLNDATHLLEPIGLRAQSDWRQTFRRIHRWARGLPGAPAARYVWNFIRGLARGRRKPSPDAQQ